MCDKRTRLAGGGGLGQAYINACKLNSIATLVALILFNLINLINLI